MKLFMTLLVLPHFAFATPTCKIRTLEYADGWLSQEMKQAFTEKGYTLIDARDDAAVDYTLKYELKTYGIYPCRVSMFTCSGSKRFANLDLLKVGSENPLITLEVSSKKSEWNELRDQMEVKFMKQIKKLPSCL